MNLALFTARRLNLSLSESQQLFHDAITLTGLLIFKSPHSWLWSSFINQLLTLEHVSQYYYHY